MELKVTINIDNIDEIKEDLRKFIGKTVVSFVDGMYGDGKPSEVPTIVGIDKAEERRKKREEEKEIVAKEPESTLEEADVIQAFLKVNSTSNRQELEGILKSFGVKRVQELDPKDYEEVIEKVKAVG